MPKANTEGASKVSEHDASKGSSRLVKLTSVYEAPPRCSSQHVKKDLKDDNLSGNSYKQKQEKVDMETTGTVYSTRSHESAAKTDIAELMRPKKHGKRSSRPRGKNSTPWVPLEGLLNSDQREPSKYGSDQNVGSKNMKSNQGGDSMPCRASKRVQKSKDIAELLAIKTDIAERIDPTKRGKRSVRPRGNKAASWVPMDGLQNFDKELSKHGNDQKVVSKKMKSTHGATTLCNNASNDLIEQTDVAMVDTLGEVKESNGADADKRTGVPMADTSDEVKDGNGSDANATEQIGVTIPDTSFEFKDSNHAGANAVEQMEVCMVDTTAEVKLSNGENEKLVVQAGVPTTETSADPKDINGAVANNAVEQTAVQTADVVDPQQGRANNAEFDPEISLGLDLHIGDENFDLSGAESALASLYGESERDLCIEFAVKLLMDEMPLPNEAAEVEEFFRQKMNDERSAKP